MCALSVTLPEFSGPLDLLYGLIQKRRLDVNAVSLAAVADQYLEQVFALDGDLEALSEFLPLGSQLLLIKSRTLLPAPPSEGDAEDLAEELRRRLQEYEVLRAPRQDGWRSRRAVPSACGRAAALSKRQQASYAWRRLPLTGSSSLSLLAKPP